MDKKEIDAYLKTIDDSGFFTAISYAVQGELVQEAISYNKELNKNGYQLTTYFGPNFSRCWAIYPKEEIRPRTTNKCLVCEYQYFRIKHGLTKKCAAFEAIGKLKIEFNSYLKKNDSI